MNDKIPEVKYGILKNTYPSERVWINLFIPTALTALHTEAAAFLINSRETVSETTNPAATASGAEI